MSTNLQNSAAASGMEKVSFHFNPNEEQCQRMFKLPIERREGGGQRMRWLDGITDSVDMNLIKFWEIMVIRRA